MKNIIFTVVLLLATTLFFLSTAQSNEIEKNTLYPNTYFAVVFDVAEKWKDCDPPLLENDKVKWIIEEHGHYMDDLHRKKIVRLGGPSVNDFEEFMEERIINGGIILYQAQSLEDLEYFIENDPIVYNGVFKVKDIRPFIAFIDDLKSDS